MNRSIEALTVSVEDQGYIPPTVLRDGRGRIVWNLRGNTPEENELLGIRNVQALFLEKFPEFDELFPREEDGKIIRSKRDEAKEFIIKYLGSSRDFSLNVGQSPFKKHAIAYFEGSYSIAVKKAFLPWGIDFKYVNNDNLQNIGNEDGQNIQAQIGVIPDGWMTKTALAKHLGTKRRVVENIASKYREEHSEWFREFDVPRRFREHYSPQLVAVIVTEMARKKLVHYKPLQENQNQTPKGWMTNASVAKQLRINPVIVRKIAERYKNDYPEWFKEFFLYTKPRIHYSPELIGLIGRYVVTQVKIMLQKAPEGWLSNDALAKKLHASPKILRYLAEDSREVNPDYFRTYITRGKGKPSVHYSPQLVTILSRAIKERREIKTKRSKEKRGVTLPCVDKKTGICISDGIMWAPIGWFAKQFDMSLTGIRGQLARLPSIKGENLGGNVSVLYNVSEGHRVLSLFISRPKVDRSSGYYTDPQNQNWVTRKWFIKKLGISYKQLAPVLQDAACVDGRDVFGRAVKLYNLSEAFNAIEKNGYLDKNRGKYRQQESISREEARAEFMKLVEDEDE